MVLVCPVQTPETLAGGKILLTEKTRQDMTSHQMEVLAIGELGYCQDFGICQRETHILRENHTLSSEDTVTAYIFHPCDAKVGDWVLVAHRSLSETDTDGVFICSQDAVLAVITV